MKKIFLLFLIISSIELYSQDYYDIKNPGNDYVKKCQECLDLITNKPKEIQFGIQRDEFDNLYFIVTRKEWFDLMFKKSGDGIAIDVVNKERYNCSINKLDKNLIIRGELHQPMYLKELKQNALPSKNGEIVIKLGAVPEKFRDKEIEFNVLFLKDKNLCYYNTFFDLKVFRWDLLDMGLYFDTLTYSNNTRRDTNVIKQEKYILQHKILRFEIPFAKNKADYSATDIKPIYDSLKLTDFNIKKITIRAYSSVEGEESRNIQLQKERAKSIVDALQEFQQSSISTEILATENWVDFLNDLLLTPYASWSNLNKDEIKTKLKDKKVAKDLDPYLEKHRKAVVILELDKKNKFEYLPIAELLEIFSKSISEKNLDEAIAIQNSIFDKIRNHEAPIDIIDKLDIPKKNEFSLLLNKSSVFKYLIDEMDVYDTYKELLSLQDLIPNDGHIKYNICALKFRVWLLGKNAIDPVQFKKEITGLKNWGIDQNLIKRMLINYEIIMCEYYMMQGDFTNKDKSLKYIYTNFKYVPLSDFDYLSLAQYYASYAKYDWATKLLSNKVKTVDVDEDLLFYYLNLTLVDDKLTKTADYRTIMLNAINFNKKRFCEIFNPFGQGGVTFQLLEDDYLRKTYCESCH